MPQFKTTELSTYTKVGYQKLKVKISIDAKGKFYCYFEKSYLPAIKEIFERSCWTETRQENKIKVYGNTFEKFEIDLNRMLKIFLEPEKTEEPVIRYNIKSRVTFAFDEDGNVYPSGFTARATKGDSWTWGDEKIYDKRSSYRWDHLGGYILAIGATAMLKTTYKYGETEKIEYNHYYAGGDSQGYTNPAEKLNSWCNMTLDEDAKEIPYSDKAALFFHNLLLGIAKLSKLIQEATFEQKDLLELINKKQFGLLQLPNPEDI